MGRRARYGRAEDTLALVGKRARAIIATTIWTSSEPQGREQATHALRLFGQVEIYQVHNLVNWRPHLRMLEGLKGEGKVVAVGATHYDPSAFSELCDVMRTGRLDMVQVPYNPNRREAERQVLPLAAELGLGVLTHSPLRDGVLDRPPGPDQISAFGVRTWAQAVLKWDRQRPARQLRINGDEDAGAADRERPGRRSTVFRSRPARATR